MRSLLTGRFQQALFHAVLDLLTLERFAHIAFLDDLQRRMADAFVRGEALLAVAAKTAASNGFTIFAGARVKNSVVICVTMWADHGQLQAGMLP